jgi:hypothetical protein
VHERCGVVRGLLSEHLDDYRTTRQHGPARDYALYPKVVQASMRGPVRLLYDQCSRNSSIASNSAAAAISGDLERLCDSALRGASSRAVASCLGLCAAELSRSQLTGRTQANRLRPALSVVASPRRATREPPVGG